MIIANRISFLAAIGALLLTGCLPYPPLISTPKLALYYSEHVSQPTGASSPFRRWLPETGTTETLPRQPGTSVLGTYDFDQLQPYGTNLLFNRVGSSITSTFLTVTDSDDPTPRLLNVYKTSDEFDYGPWTRWAPDGKHIGMQVGRSLIITAADGSDRKTIDTLDSFATQFSWSPDGSKLAYTKASDVMKVVDINTGEKTSFNAPGPDLDMDYGPEWTTDNRHIVMDLREDIEDRTFIFDIENPTSAQEKKLDADGCWISKFWARQHDRLIQSQICDDSENQFQLIFMDSRPNIPLPTAPLNSYATFRDYSPAWSQDGEKFSYVTDANDDGNADIVIANKDGVILQTLANIGASSIAAIEWSPDNTKLFVATTADEVDVETVRGRFLTVNTGTQGPSFTLAGNPEFSFVRIDWSPDSRDVVFRIETYDEDTGYDVNAPALLIDTENSDTKATPLFVEGVLWSPDSKYLAVKTLNDTNDLNEDRRYTVSVIGVTGDNRATTTIAENADYVIQWSDPRAGK